MQVTVKYHLFGIPGKLSCGLALILTAGALSPSLYAAISAVHVQGSPAPPQVLGTTIKLTATAVDTDPGPLTYKWEVESPGSSSFVLMQDFDVAAAFEWTPNYTEGTYMLRVTARDHLAGTSVQQVVGFHVNPLVTGSQAVVAPTANPLVALFSAPTCPIGSTMRATFQPDNGAFQSFTDWRACHAGSMNFYIAGMEASQTFLMSYQVDTGGTITTSAQAAFTTGTIPASVKFPAMTVAVPPVAGQSDTTDRIVLSGFAAAPYPITATDLNANVIWYYPSSPTQLTRSVPGGTILTIADGTGTGTGVWGPAITRQQILREIDLAGNTVRETNADRVMEQLTAMGMTDPLGCFNHDAIRLGANLTGSAAGLRGYTIAIGDVQRIFPAGTQGASGPIDIVGTIAIVLDTNLQVVGYWNAFDHDCSGSGGTTCPGGLSINRPAVRGEACTTGAGLAGCPPALLSSPANDWLHNNSIQYLPSDGDLLLSMRDQDWVVKIDYNNGVKTGGLGTGNILWILGLDGNFSLGNNSGQPYPWFSAQHDAGFATPPGANPEQIFTVFDNGVSRHDEYGGNSRGQVWNINQTKMTATLTTDANLGAYSFSLGSAQMLTNGNFMFMAGTIQAANSLIETQNTEVLPAGAISYQFQALGPVSYRGARLTDFYNVQANGSSGPE